MSTIEETIEVRVPVTMAYNQWTQFEDFPTFMEGVEEVRQIDDTHLHWRAEIAGRAKEWDAKITDQSPDRCVAWTATDGAGNGGVITFHPVSDERTQVKAKMDVEPEGVAEKAGDVLGVVKRRVKGDLERFKKLIEARGSESGAWRGEVRDGQRTDTGNGATAAQRPLGSGHGTKPTGGFEPHR
jgi:uncharacterized membrane protein